ncbi:hypothetical protein L7F22_062401 [Adiantum nelumboides]|nr:hypothetical protein [Adiantum nelumboides]
MADTSSSSDPKSLFEIRRFDGTGFELLKDRMQGIFFLKDCDNALAANKLEGMLDADWTKINRKAVTYIKMVVTDDILPAIKGLDTAMFSPVGHYFASASHDRTARVWCMDRVQPLRIMVGHFSDVDCVQWHVNCNYIATGSSDKTVRLWDVATGECMRLFTGHRGMVTCLAMSPDGRYMASGDEDGAIMMWDLGSGQSITPLLGHTGCVWTLDFSCEGSLLASGSADNSVRVWDVNGSLKTPWIEEKSAVRRLRLLKTLPTRATPVYTLRFSKRNLLFAAGAFNPTTSN